jgi:hypothetical protein
MIIKLQFYHLPVPISFASFYQTSINQVPKATAAKGGAD